MDTIAECYGKATLALLGRTILDDGSIQLLVAATTDHGRMEGALMVVPDSRAITADDPRAQNPGADGPVLFLARDGDRVTGRLPGHVFLMRDLAGEHPPTHLVLSVKRQREEVGADDVRHHPALALGDLDDDSGGQPCQVSLNHVPYVPGTLHGKLPRQCFASALLVFERLQRQVSPKQDIKTLQRGFGELLDWAFNDWQATLMEDGRSLDVDWVLGDGVDQGDLAAITGDTFSDENAKRAAAYNRMVAASMPYDLMAERMDGFERRLEDIELFLEGLIAQNGRLWGTQGRGNLTEAIAEARKPASQRAIERLVFVNDEKLRVSIALFMERPWLQHGYWAKQLAEARLFALTIGAHLDYPDLARAEQRVLGRSWPDVVARLAAVAFAAGLLVADKPFWAITFMLVVIAERLRPGRREAIHQAESQIIELADMQRALVNEYLSWEDRGALYVAVEPPLDPEVVYERLSLMESKYPMAMPHELMSLLRFCGRKGMPLLRELEHDWHALRLEDAESVLADYYNRSGTDDEAASAAA